MIVVKVPWGGEMTIVETVDPTLSTIARRYVTQVLLFLQKKNEEFVLVIHHFQ